MKNSRDTVDYNHVVLIILIENLSGYQILKNRVIQEKQKC